MKLAEEIVVTGQPGGRFELEIDGAQFPWWIGRDGATVTVTPNEMPGVSIFIPAERVRVLHEITAPKETA